MWPFDITATRCRDPGGRYQSLTSSMVEQCTPPPNFWT